MNLAITVAPFIADSGYTLGPLGMGIALTYISMKTGWLALGVSTLMFTSLMKLLEHREKTIVQKQ